MKKATIKNYNFITQTKINVFLYGLLKDAVIQTIRHEQTHIYIHVVFLDEQVYF